MQNTDFEKTLLKYTVLGLLILLIIIGAVVGIYVVDTATLRRDMLDYAQESIRLQHEQLKADKEQSLDKGYEELKQLERLISDYKNNSMEMDDLLRGMETEINTIRQRS